MMWGHLPPLRYFFILETYILFVEYGRVYRESADIFHIS